MTLLVVGLFPRWNLKMRKYTGFSGSAPLKKPLFLEKVDLVRLTLSTKGSLEISLEVKYGGRHHPGVVS